MMALTADALKVWLQLDLVLFYCEKHKQDKGNEKGS